MKESIIPLSEPNISGKEWEYIKDCIDSTWVSSSGAYVSIFEEKISQYTHSKYAIACINGTSALQLSLHLAGVKPGHEVIVPTLTFIAPINAVIYNGAIPIFMDANKFYNIDNDKTIDFIKNETIYKNGFTFNKKTKNMISAIIPVHVWGNAVYFDDLIKICKERNISIIEDASESLGSVYTKGKYQRKHTGTIGDLGCLSFNGNKIITSGGGGMILTNDKKIAIKARYLSTQAKDDPIRYIHNKVGYNFRLSNIQAALGVAQIERLPEFVKKKHNIFKQYSNTISKIDGLNVVSAPDYANNNHWLNLLQIDKEIFGMDSYMLMSKLEKNGVQTRPVWLPNHLQKPFRNFQSYKIKNSIKLVDKSLCLPSSTNITNDRIEKIVSCLNN